MVAVIMDTLYKKIIDTSPTDDFFQTIFMVSEIPTKPQAVKSSCTMEVVRVHIISIHSMYMYRVSLHILSNYSANIMNVHHKSGDWWRYFGIIFVLIDKWGVKLFEFKHRLVIFSPT